MTTRAAWSRLLGGCLVAAAVTLLGPVSVAADTLHDANDPTYNPSSAALAGAGGGTATPAAPGTIPISWEFKRFYDRSGGVPIFGYAISMPVLENGLRVQYFERQRLEHHPEKAGTAYEVELGRLGADEAARRGLLETAPFAPQPGGSAPGCDYFAETGHWLCNGFRHYWKSHGVELGDPGVSFRESLALFGYPISEEFVENGVTVQYFERARFEYHPGTGAAHDTLLGLVGYPAWAAAEPTAVAAPLQAPPVGELIKEEALRHLGAPYVWGGTTPAGFDCSGFVYYVVNQVLGGGFPRNMDAQVASGVPVDPKDLHPGDLVFQQNTYQWGLSHAGIYIGDGKFIHASMPGVGVTISDLWDGYWGPRFYAARRVGV
ncbi:MAG: C40 family peptidase [Sphaerobacter thermophilus]|uniref:C40 family peptidase n=1 Tax=Sphaerobacter thermophilus TaxID=2057 RepID=UPI0011D03EAF|nr:C40 family peptidase [Sphaerobacter thermophilus]